ncbi:MAG: hypothetical protein GX369_03050 [Euryarchaeota archaeon]|nr:hypothetical protein [Euryarchaeota archaeon]
MHWILASKIIITVAILFLASRADWKTREASDIFWIVLGIFGMIFLITQIYLDEVNSAYYLILFPIAVFFLDIFWDRDGFFENGVNLTPLVLYIGAFVSLAWLVSKYHSDLYLWKLLLIPILFFLFIILYQFDIIKGGADAKALIALTIMFPMYPQGYGFPLIGAAVNMKDFILPFPVLILFNAAILTLIVPITMFILNILRKDIEFPTMFLGYRMFIDDIQNKHVWPMESVVDGRIKVELFPQNSCDITDQVNELRMMGADSIWVTPKIPFLIPITISVLMSIFVGNLLFLIIQ